MASSSKKRQLPELKPTKWGDIVYKVAGNIVRPLYNLVIDIEFRGQNKLPRGGFIVVANHTSMVDPITVAYPMFIKGALPRFLAKESLFHAPALGWLMRTIAHVPVSRGSVDARKSLETAQNIVDAGGSIIIYPEGTLTTDPDGWPMSGRTGAARLALATGAPVVPIAHWGDHEFLPYSGKPVFGKRHRAVVSIGDPLDFSDLVDKNGSSKPTRAQLMEVTDRMMDSVTELLADIRGEEAPTGRWNPSTGVREPRIEGGR
ncbi:1-acyl-sn-glycerol-3-phosphate acyltransferase [Rothia sp. ZJ932]|uniref:lysophospholipid acyltransferase family protein n=1 Tax=Rothia sp. ZJ932 TaxID=2810516 RepID=UPI001966E3C2|nr:lysophospholipid acyltransferase family protein [Rothia sp. ZJ932]QRZ62327.1 1-acyl-sn-glycerol-3-phosphate acyltransferase [Rothia sp. ZJ932]